MPNQGAVEKIMAAVEKIMAPTNLSQGNSRANILIPDPRHHLSLWIALVVFLTLGQIAATAFVPRSLSLTLITDVIDRKSTRLNSSHLVISYAVFCL